MKKILKSTLLIILILSSAVNAEDICLVNISKGTVTCQDSVFSLMTGTTKVFKNTAQKTAYIMSTLYNDSAFEVLGTHSNCSGDLFYTVLRKN